MEESRFERLAESLEQAIAYKRGNQSVARSIERMFNLPSFNQDEIVVLRAQLGLSRQALANVIGVSKRTLEAWESGARSPSGPARALLYLLRKDRLVLSLLVHRSTTVSSSH